ncbi:PH domain-containing protein [Actinocatenispora rupis]|uniref:Low molecular weight protein antigen 6 PH domain-containing protein n=1 Tax=Actinocatenispora rupis TaxID=519421 RepID=A0A8J3NC07_9ACTN|nr:hypothetical protein [Actinocatenispora rupis]GID13894.1 hypothetical protein Aru02nite_47830 [Actinocatenispora rupis]
MSVGVRFRADEARRGSAWAAALLTLAGFTQVAAGILEGMLSDSVALTGMYLVAAVLFFGSAWQSWHVVHHGYTEPTPAGLVVRRGGAARLVPWREITELRPQQRGRYLRVRLRRTSGRDMWLVAPLTRASRPSPRFGDELRTLHAWWRAPRP